ncbi:DeoR/GlpR transcriptional regulator [Phototrophicus methaneseepsis]|uniref:DeoR/GlpR transcriptional regulator n=1 Tax=Phototrophicus methaneseepsis TaxID=2710758 RepID=A0A7S8IF13_9CHLR|nr:DeoR/GlpR family DNA-binding transcription regulator [Phototrophicus methaneseepsis]QPC84240.1 DeoR/GlpR transcriptional regulator [Phototrophicus methaneseepsis]
MSDSLFLEERRRLILEQLRDRGRVFVNDLSRQMNVSAVTIRQDLRALEADGLLARTHGGAVQPARLGAEQPELSFDIRRTQNQEEKDALGRAAAQMVEPGYAIALDASTTVCSIVPYLAHLDSLTIVTNNLLVAEMVLPYPRIRVLMPGGRMRRDSFSLVGLPQSLPDINLNIGFMSAWGITPQNGLTEVSEDEMTMKQALLARSLRKVVLVDSSKWGQVAPYTYARASDVDIILTTGRTPAVARHALHEGHIQVVPVA